MSKFPLPRNFFRCPQLSLEEHAHLTAVAEQASVELIRNARHDRSPIRWSLVDDDQDLQVYVGVDPHAPSGVITYSSTTHLYATLDDVAELFKSETPQQYEDYRRNFAQDLMDGASLYTLAAPTEDNPRHFVGVKWMAMSSPVPAVIKPRDFCAVESRYDFEIEGRRGWARCLKSVRMACCPDFEASLGLVRGSYHRVGYVFIESDRPGYLQATLLMQLDTGGQLPKWLSKFSAKRRARALGDMESYLREKRLSQTRFLADYDLVDRNNRSRCFLCQRKFGTFGIKHSCRKCGEVVCKSCSKAWTVQHSGITQSLRVCTSCSIGKNAVSTTGSCYEDPEGSVSISATSQPPRRGHVVTPVSTSRLAGPPKTPSYRTPTNRQFQRSTFLQETTTTNSTTSRDTLDDMLDQMEISERLERLQNARDRDVPTTRQWQPSRCLELTPEDVPKDAFANHSYHTPKHSATRVRAVTSPAFANRSGRPPMPTQATEARNDLIPIDFSNLNLTQEYTKDSMTESTFDSEGPASPEVWRGGVRAGMM